MRLSLWASLVGVSVLATPAFGLQLNATEWFQDTRIGLTGSWKTGTILPNHGGGYLYGLASTSSDIDTVTFTPGLDYSVYDVSMSIVPYPTRAQAVPVTVTYLGGTTTVLVDQSNMALSQTWVSLGSFTFSSDVGRVQVSTASTNRASVTVDSVMFEVNSSATRSSVSPTPSPRSDDWEASCKAGDQRHYCVRDCCEFYYYCRDGVAGDLRSSPTGTLCHDDPYTNDVKFVHSGSDEYCYGVTCPIAFSDVVGLYYSHPGSQLQCAAEATAVTPGLATSSNTLMYDSSMTSSTATVTFSFPTVTATENTRFAALTWCPNTRTNSWYVDGMRWEVPVSDAFMWNQFDGVMTDSSVELKVFEQGCEISMVYLGDETPTGGMWTKDCGTTTTPTTGRICPTGATHLSSNLLVQTNGYLNLGNAASSATFDFKSNGDTLWLAASCAAGMLVNGQTWVPPAGSSASIAWYEVGIIQQGGTVSTASVNLEQPSTAVGGCVVAMLYYGAFTPDASWLDPCPNFNVIQCPSAAVSIDPSLLNRNGYMVATDVTAFRSSAQFGWSGTGNALVWAKTRCDATAGPQWQAITTGTSGSSLPVTFPTNDVFTWNSVGTIDLTNVITLQNLQRDCPIQFLYAGTHVPNDAFNMSCATADYTKDFFCPYESQLSDRSLITDADTLSLSQAGADAFYGSATFEFTRPGFFWAKAKCSDGWLAHLPAWEVNNAEWSFAATSSFAWYRFGWIDTNVVWLRALQPECEIEYVYMGDFTPDTTGTAWSLDCSQGTASTEPLAPFCYPGETRSKCLGHCCSSFYHCVAGNALQLLHTPPGTKCMSEPEGAILISEADCEGITCVADECSMNAGCSDRCVDQEDGFRCECNSNTRSLQADGKTCNTTESCAGACGGQSLYGSCWCNTECAAYGDCCPDRATECPSPTDSWASESCAGQCGNELTTCFCDSECATHGDCCSDYSSYCNAAGASDSSTPSPSPSPSKYMQTSGTLYSSGGTSSVYGNNENYYTRLQCSAIENVEVTYTLRPTGTGNDFLRVLDGVSTATSIELCRSSQTNPVCTSTGQTVQVQFSSDSSGTGYWRMDWRCVTASEFVIDLEEVPLRATVTYQGQWATPPASSVIGGLYNSYYARASGGSNDATVTVCPTLTEANTYGVFMWYPTTNNPNQYASSNVEVFVQYAGGYIDYPIVNQRTNPSDWLKLGTYPFDAGSDGCVMVNSYGTDGDFVFADAFRFIRYVDVVIADTEVGGQASITGIWDTASTGSPRRGTNYFIATADGTDQRIEMMGSVAAAGQYRVEFSLPSGISLSGQNALVVVEHAGGSFMTAASSLVADSYGWANLGTFQFDVGTQVLVKVDMEGASTGSQMVVDAIRMVYVDSYVAFNLNAITLDSNFYQKKKRANQKEGNDPKIERDTQVRIVGDWRTSRSGMSLNGDHLYTTGRLSGSTDAPRVEYAMRPYPGTYELQLWYYAHRNRAKRVPVEIAHSRQGGSSVSRVYVDMTTGGGQWVSAGHYEFEGGNVVVTLDTKGAEGFVVADGVRLVPLGSELVVDSEDSEHVVTEGPWGQGAALPHHGESYKYTSGPGRQIAFFPQLQSSGYFNVSVMYASHPNRGSAVEHFVTHANGKSTVLVDQRTMGGEWVMLGTYEFEKDASCSVTVKSASGGGYVSADAVRFVPVGTSKVGALAAPAMSTEEVIMDSTDAAMVLRGRWRQLASSTGKAYGRTYMVTSSSAASAMFRAAVQDGVYEVYLWWYGHQNRATHVPVAIESRGSTTIVHVDMTASGRQWIKLGSFAMDQSVSVTISPEVGSNGFVVADAVRLVHIA